jgi:hypothetical protein
VDTRVKLAGILHKTQQKSDMQVQASQVDVKDQSDAI